jgi:hypothetical protein
MEPWREVRKQGGRRGRIWKQFHPLYFIDDFIWYFGCADEIAKKKIVLGKTMK